MRGYWESAEAVERAYRYRWLRIARAIVDQEPRRKGRSGARDALAFRQAFREDIKPLPGWPKPRAELALDLGFHTSQRQPPSLWTLPKHYLDLLGETKALPEDPGPLLYRDDRQVKMLFVSCSHGWDRVTPAKPSIIVIARARSEALADMRLAARLLDELDGWDDFTDDWVTDDNHPWFEDITETERANWPEPLAPQFRFQERQGRQEQLLSRNDRMLRSILLRSGNWLLTGKDPERRKLQRLADLGVDSVVDWLDELHQDARRFLDLAIRIKFPPLPLHSGDGGPFEAGVRQACKDFLARWPVFSPLLVPLRVTLLLVPPERSPKSTKDLDNLPLQVLSIVEEELRPHAEPWLLAPPIPSSDPEHDADKETRLKRLRTLSTSAIWAYQVLELHRQPADHAEGQLILMLGHGWNLRSVWAEAEDYVDRHIDELGDLE